MRLPLAACLFSLSLLVGCYDLSPSGTAPPASEVGKGEKSGSDENDATHDAAGIELKILDWDGLQQLIASHRGKVVVLDCWSTSCIPCIEEFPNLVALHNKHSRDELACISLSFDYEGIGRPEEQRDRVLEFLREQRAEFDNVLSSLDSDALTAKLDIPSIPAVFVFDQQGRLARRFDNRHASRSGGPFTYKQVTAVVEDLLAANSADAE